MEFFDFSIIDNYKIKGLDEFWKEASLISKLKPHANIVQFFGICLNPLCVVSEFLEKGDLRHYLDDKQNKIERKQMISWIKQIALGKKKKNLKKRKFEFFEFTIINKLKQGCCI